MNEDSLPRENLEQDYWPLAVEIVVAWGDMDALGHVNNTRFLRWFEDARFEVFQRIGSTDLGPKTATGPILARVECVFRKPVLHPDTVSSKIRVSEVEQDRYTLEHRVESRQQQQVVAIGTSRIVEVDYRSGKPVELSGALREQLQKLR